VHKDDKPAVAKTAKGANGDEAKSNPHDRKAELEKEAERRAREKREQQ